jgi:rhamnulokinase
MTRKLIAIGNVLMQLTALGEIEDLEQARHLVRESFPAVMYEPRENDAWDGAKAALQADGGMVIWRWVKRHG